MCNLLKIKFCPALKVFFDDFGVPGGLLGDSWDPKSTPKRPKIASGGNLGPESVFGPILDHFGSDLGGIGAPMWEPQIDQKSINFSSCFWIRFWYHFGSILKAKNDPT